MGPSPPVMSRRSACAVAFRMASLMSWRESSQVWWYLMVRPRSYIFWLR